MKSPHIVYLVGAGPGHPQLMTLRGKEVLEQADVLIYDALASTEFLHWVPEHCERIYVGKRAGNHALTQEGINELLIKKAQKTARVVRLKGGDPYVFGRGSEEALALAEAGIDFEVVPGISSAIGGLSYAGIPITDREFASQFTVLTGHENPHKEKSALNYKELAQSPGTKVILMGMSNLETICTELLSQGASPTLPAAIIQWAGTDRQRAITAPLNELFIKAQEAKLEAPALIVLGEVVTRRDKLNWYEKLPLFGKKIVVTRTQEQASVLSDKLRQLGATVYELPTIKTTHPTDKMGFAESVVHCHSYSWLVFSSPTGVKKFFEAFFAVYSDIRCIGGVKIAAVGPATAKAIRAYGLAVDIVPNKAVAEELVAEFPRYSKENNYDIAHETVLWIHGEKARPVIAEGLNALHAIVDECIAYDTAPETSDPTGIIAQWATLEPDCITFTSASTAKNFFALNLNLSKSCKLASIGPVTTEALQQLGQTISITAKKHDIDGLVSALIQKFAHK